MEVIGGGMGNCILSNRGCNAILGGCNNCISSSIDGVNSYLNTIGGGRDNTIDAEEHNIIGGGQFGTIRGNNFANHVIAGGSTNSITGSHTAGSGYNNTISGGNLNLIKTDSTNHSNTISGGQCNTITGSICNSNIGGGCYNKIRNSNASVIAGGVCSNIIDSEYSFIGGGFFKLGISNSPNSAIVGGCTNTIQGGATGSFVGGGISNGVYNFTSSAADPKEGLNSVVGGYNNKTVATSLGFIGGGSGSQAFDSIATVIVGGIDNLIQCGSHHVIVGGCSNTIIDFQGGSCFGNFVGGGTNNRISTANDSSILGGSDSCIQNTARAVISGGCLNNIRSGANYSGMGGGRENLIEKSYSHVGGGQQNTSSDIYSFIGSGRCNCINTSLSTTGYNAIVSGCSNNITIAKSSTIVGGETQSISLGTGQFIGGGTNNTIGSNGWSVIGGGQNHSIGNGCWGFIGGGLCNVISGGCSNCNTKYSGILGGNNNLVCVNSSFIVGVNLTTTTSCTTYMNNATINTHLQVGGTATLNATAGRIDATNDVVAFSTSDKRLKENILPIKDALCKVIGVSGNTFNWKELTKEDTKTIHGNTGKDVGVIAQEIEAILPEAVTTRDSGYKAVNYEKLVPLLIEAVKDLTLKVEKLEAKIGWDS
jgi:hypothetical protein